MGRMCDARASVFTTSGLRADGVSGTILTARIADGTLFRARRGVYVAPTICPALRAVAEHGGRAACITAARHLGLWVLTADHRAHVWLCSGQRSYHPSQACACVEHWADGPHGAPASAPSLPRMLLQIYRCFGIEEFFVVLESALAAGMLGTSGMRWLRMHSNAAIREALALARNDADSGLESLLRWRLRRRGLRVRTQRQVFAVGRVDLLIGERLLVEADGVDNHNSPPHRHKDLVRDAHAASWGYITLRFDYAMIVHDWELVEAAILGALSTLEGAGSAESERQGIAPVSRRVAPRYRRVAHDPLPLTRASAPHAAPAHRRAGQSRGLSR